MGGPIARRGRYALWLLPLVLAASGGRAQDASVTAVDADAPPPSLEGCAPPMPPPPRALAAGSCVQSMLDANDPALEPEVYYEDYTLALRAGESVQIDMDAIPPPQAAPPELADPIEGEAEFDTALEIFAAGGQRRLAFNDDRRGSLNSTILFVAPADGDYVVRARSFSGGSGDFVLRVTAVPPPPPPLPLVASVSGRLTQEDIARERLDPSFGGVRYQFQGNAGERLRLNLRSSIQGASLWIQDPEGGRALTIQAGSGNAAPVLLIAHTGPYLVRVTAGRLIEAQDFTLELSRGAAPPGPLAPIPLPRGRPLAGRLTLGSEVGMLRTDRVSYFYQAYSLPVVAGETVVVEMQSTDFRPTLDVGALTPLGYANVPIAGANASRRVRRLPGNATTARLELRPERAGTLIVRARSNAAGIGAFTLSAGARAPAAPPAQAGPPAPAPAPEQDPPG